MPKHNRGFSFGSKSSKSHRSSTSANRVALTESAEEKQRRNLQTKADPTLAMSELQPSTFFYIFSPTFNTTISVAN